ncbi:hypothetical protein MMC06_002080 [Schaereria dolodes]|nr:hypothetical protein [Schaereria dolodes]
MASPMGIEGTWFDGLRRKWQNVPIDASRDNAIATSEFLEAAESVTPLCDLMGSVAFVPVRQDMLGNIKKIRDRQLAAPADSENLQTLVISELKIKKHTATEGLLWLTRGLDFFAQALRHNISNPTEELSTSYRHAYAGTLRPHHSFMVKPIFAAAMSATPYRKDLHAKLGNDPVKVDEALEAWVSGLEERVSIIKQFLGRKEAKW